MVVDTDLQGWLLLIAQSRNGPMAVASPWRLPGLHKRRIGSCDLISSLSTVCLKYKGSLFLYYTSLVR